MSRIVQCPRCRVLLQEPPPGNPYYQCGSCSTTLQAKHATKADLESTHMRFSQSQCQNQQDDCKGKQNSKGSKADTSSSGGTTERVVGMDDHAYGGDGSPSSWSAHKNDGAAGPVFGHARTGGVGVQDHFRPSSENLKTAKTQQHPDHQGGRGYISVPVNHYPHSKQMMNFDKTVDRNPPMSAYGAEYGHRRTVSATATAGGSHSSPSSFHESSSSSGGSGFSPSRHQPMSSASRAGASATSFGSGDAENEPLRATQRGANFVQQQQELLRTHSDPVTVSDQLQLKSVPGVMRGEPSASTLGGKHLASSSSVRTRLTWKSTQTHPEQGEKQGALSPREIDVVVNNRGIVDDDRIATRLLNENRVRETSPIEHVTEKNWREFKSRRHGKQEEKNKAHDDAQQQQHIQRTQSDVSEKNFDMYGNSPSVSTHDGAGEKPDYEASETSSTMDEGEGSGGRSSPPPALQLPDIRGGIPRSPSRALPRSSDASSLRMNSYSEDANRQASTMPTELDSSEDPHHRLDTVNRNNRRRQLSWDATRMAAPSGSNTGSPVPFTESGLRKSSSDDYVNMIKEPPEPVIHHTRISSDPTTDGVYHQQHQMDQQNQWVARLKQQPVRAYSAVSSPTGSSSVVVATSRPPTHAQYDRSASGSNLHTPHAESGPAVPGHTPPTPNQSMVAMSDSAASPGQLPPRRANYPPLPLPGALPHVNCQHCHILLAVPVNLPPPKTNTQKLRCGRCKKISIFSVPQYSGEPAYNGSGSNAQYGQSLFAASPDHHDSSSNSGYRTTSGRSMSATSDELRGSGRRFSDLSEKSSSITRNDSSGSGDIPVEEELAERTRLMNIDSHSYSNPAIATNSEPHHPSDPAALRSYSDGHSPSTSDCRSRFGRVNSPGPLYPKRGGLSLEHGPGSGSNSSGRYQPDERSRFAVDHRPSSRRHEEGVTSSDSETEHHQTLPHGSPQMEGHGYHRHNHSSSRSPPQHHSRTPTVSASGHGENSGKEHAHCENTRGFNKALKGLINIKTSISHLTHRGHKDHTNHARTKVTINGVHIPDNIVKRAEEHAGPVMPGSYWYDERAGFWGVQGGQCEGIIPPYIEEFRYPMSRDCAGGRTGVLVNGRELHARDLEKLAMRGLPNTSGRSYRIEIDGTVVDEATGVELKGLGQLAPSVEQSRRGKGMSAHTK